MTRTLLILGASVAFATTMPLRFEPNRGQAPTEALFVGRSASNVFAVTANGLVIGQSKLEFTCAGGWRGDTPARSKATFIRATRSVTVEQFERIRCIDTAPGIDAVFYENARGEFEYDLHLAPYADINRVVWKLHGDLQLRPPVATQDGRNVDVRFTESRRAAQKDGSRSSPSPNSPSGTPRPSVRSAAQPTPQACPLATAHPLPRKNESRSSPAPNSPSGTPHRR